MYKIERERKREREREHHVSISFFVLLLTSDKFWKIAVFDMKEESKRKKKVTGPMNTTAIQKTKTYADIFWIFYQRDFILLFKSVSYE